METTKQEQINEMLLYVPQTIVAYDANPKGQHLYGEQRRQIAIALYDVGYRKMPNDIRELFDVLAEGANIKEKLNEIKRLEKENEQLKAKLKARLTCDFVKTRQNYAGQDSADKLKDEIKQAKIDVLNELKEKCKFDGHTVAVYKNDIEEMIKEYE